MVAVATGTSVSVKLVSPRIRLSGLPGGEPPLSAWLSKKLTVASLIPGKSLNENWKFAAAAREPPRMTSFAAVAGSSNGSTMLRVW